MMTLPPIEKQFVVDTYDKIASEFDTTRYSVWNNVKNFINSLKSGTKLFEAGCGNGKNIFYRNDIAPHGCDISQNLINICQTKAQCIRDSLFVGDITNLPIHYTDYFDNTMSVAVLHHLSTIERRVKAILELVRVTKPGGKIFIEVWAKEQNPVSTSLSHSSDIETFHKCRHQFTEQDVYVPFKNRFNGDIIADRYYHVFVDGELDNLVDNIKNITVINKFYEKANFGIILQKSM
jgi:SAM-dependent methyltransferase